tara:strand:+ start:32331 stop:33818 length:1488 start_codon:yes stop_codon:yes gene_type:complete
MARQALIKLRRGSGAPADGTLTEGELAIDISAKKLYSANATGNSFTLSGDQYNLTSTSNATHGIVNLNVDNTSLSNDQIQFVGSGGITVSGNSTVIDIQQTETDYDISAGGTSSTGTLVLGGDADADTITITGNNGLVVTNTSTTALLVENKGSQHVVTVVSDGGNKYAIDGTTQQKLRLVPGVIYWFDQSDGTNNGHPLAFGTAANGSEVSQGTASGFKIYEQVGSPGNAGAYTRVQLEQDAPNHLYYFCEIHSGMGSDVYVQPDNLYSNATHVVATQPLNVTGVGTFSGNVSASHVIASGDVDITGEVNAASAAIVGAATVGSTLGVTSTITAGADVDITGEVNAASAAIVGAASIGSTLTAGADVDITGEVNAASAAIVGAATVGGVLTVSGNLIVSGTTTTVSSTTVEINDNLIKLAANQTATDADLVDTGLYMTFDDSDTQKFSGMFRDKSNSNKAFVFIEGITGEPGNEVSYTASNLAYIEAIIDGGTY